MRLGMKGYVAGLLLMASGLTATAQAAFDHGHTAWNGLLQKHVVDVSGGHASRVDYRGFSGDAAALDAYLKNLEAVTRQEYEGFSPDEKKAFLINAYNAFTIKLILTRYPDLESIKDLGNLLKSPWKISFFNLLGEPRHLDWIEHDVLRKPGDFDDPRIHFAVNCASIGCPKLQREAFQAARLEQQLDVAMKVFLQDRTRNYHDADAGTVYLSKIFDWFEGDFERAYGSLDAFVVRHAADLGMTAASNGKDAPDISFTDYDWNLNDVETPRAQHDHSGGAR